ncbi:hypothetical protein GCM10010277_59960 [Streptomyces longisporoflavus]|uniref:hypothetical protein n=1 Tax=Streptomyces longisporoflavus TaxID=28044 RepID=UPI00167DB8DE|nr:hypothetical protein [Streptomyces longisporoflavus]GGV57747.1 hypothetical protein GCM10010277_59960 [Streptomyces longisporoflavus]
MTSHRPEAVQSTVRPVGRLVARLNRAAELLDRLGGCCTVDRAAELLGALLDNRYEARSTKGKTHT